MVKSFRWKKVIAVMLMLTLFFGLTDGVKKTEAASKPTGFTVLPSAESGVWNYIPAQVKTSFTFDEPIFVYIGYIMDLSGTGNDYFNFDYTIYKVTQGTESLYKSGTDRLNGAPNSCGGSLNIFLGDTYKWNLITEPGTYRIVVSFKGLQEETTITIYEKGAEIPTTTGSTVTGMSMIGVDGYFMTGSLGRAVDRINEIRQEAYNEGLVKSYVPIRLSAQLEAIAQTRAAEAALVNTHRRPNGLDCFSLIQGGVDSDAECLAWNHSSTDGMLMAIDQWYGEKSDYVNKTGGVTGHYTSLIRPSNTFIGLGCFFTETDVKYPNSIAAEFSSDTRNTAITETANKSGRVIQKIEVPTKKVSVEPISTITTRPGDARMFGLPVKFDSSVDAAIYDIEWTSSNPAVASVTNGEFRCDSVGACELSTIYNDTPYSLKLMFENPLKVSGGGTLRTSSKKKMSFAIESIFSVSDAQGAVTYEKVSGISKITINRTTGRITVKKGLKKKKSYKVSVAVTASGNELYQSGTKTAEFSVKAV